MLMNNNEHLDLVQTIKLESEGASAEVSEEATTESINAAQTGDSTNVAVYGILTVATIAPAGGVFLTSRCSFLKILILSFLKTYFSGI